MDALQLVTDIGKLIHDSFPLPTVTDKASVKDFGLRIWPDVVDLLYDALAGGVTPAQLASQLGKCCAAPDGVSAPAWDNVWQLVQKYAPLILSLFQMIWQGNQKEQPKPAPTPAPADGGEGEAPVVG